MIAGGNHTAIYGLSRTIIFAKGENANESPAGLPHGCEGCGEFLWG